MRLDAGHQAHPLGHLTTGAAQVDRLPAGPGRARALDHGGADALADELQGESEAGDAAARDEDADAAVVRCHEVLQSDETNV
ncbi:hypothetical protein L2X98_27965 [Microbacterium elymi]|uniref:Uncharacterized protein n=1 Tax=Microbacterium elymi TaxID=2909587 RepID=A0ABY5NH18_9MICO|nr:hypothetical protein [Microbacterium elymi]UUT34434.1 hypothetical protein L2X98_27965 [Microbacterium elymi]